MLLHMLGNWLFSDLVRVWWWTITTVGDWPSHSSLCIVADNTHQFWIGLIGIDYTCVYYFWVSVYIFFNINENHLRFYLYISYFEVKKNRYFFVVMKNIYNFWNMSYFLFPFPDIPLNRTPITLNLYKLCHRIQNFL